MQRILLADDTDFVRHAIRKVLEAEGYIVFEASDGLGALEQADEIAPDLAIFDVSMPKLNGIQTASIFHAKFPAVPIILLTIFDVGSALTCAVGVSAAIEKTEASGKLLEFVHRFLPPHGGRISGTPVPRPASAD